MRNARPISARYRLAVLSRSVAAVAGGYGVSVLLAVAVAWTMPLSREEASIVATMIALLGLPIVMMACFYARTAFRAWIGLAIAASLLAGLAFAAGWRP
ncbi:iron transporter [Sphingomonas lycopersici]|uniref:iron transporter n=1 Tax=Sphingomonas lycopersici TaxID=2951807 RepID=UPI002237868C|nr:iron transporter [Sphingomonas lycopersici]